MGRYLFSGYFLASAVAVAVVVWWIKTIGSLSALFHEVESARGALVAQLRQRHDLIPDVLKAAREAVRVQIEEVQRLAATGAAGATPGAGASQASGKGGLPDWGRPEVKVAVGHYQRLDPSAYAELQRAMKSTEENVAAARRFVEAAIGNYNCAVVAFPDTLVAWIHRYRKIPNAPLTAAIDAKPDYFG